MKVLIKSLIAYFVGILVIKQEYASLYVKTSSLSCYGNPDFVENVSCKLKPLNWERSEAIMDCDLVYSVRNVTIRMEVFKYTNQFRPFLINTTLDLCAVVRKRYFNAYGKVLLHVLTQYTNINHTCPYSGHILVRNAYLDASLMPFHAPVGKYKIFLSFYDGWPQKLLGTVGIILENLQRKPNLTRKTKKQ